MGTMRFAHGHIISTKDKDISLINVITEEKFNTLFDCVIPL